MKQFISSLAAIAALIILPAVESSSPFVISDDRVRSKDITPVLGRGYSIMTNTYQSTCLVVDTTTIPSFNYDYYFTQVTSDTTVGKISELLSGKDSGSVSFDWKLTFLGFHFDVMSTGAADTLAIKDSAAPLKTQILLSTMKIERYYASVREDVSPLVTDAITLLQSQDYVGFFKSCGPNYVRGLRRAQEVVAGISYMTGSAELAKEFAKGVENSGENDPSADPKFRGIERLTIDIRGWGMGLSQEGSETLVATSLSDYNKVMKFAFNSMTKAPNAHHIGMVYGMEVVPWVNNLQFNLAANVGDEPVLIPLARNLLPKATQVTGSTITFADGEEKKFNCLEDSSHVIDKYGFCCDLSDMKPVVAGNACTTDAAITYSSDCYCAPKKELDKSIVRDNMSNNGEFVARLDSALRYKMAFLGTLEKCVSAVRSIPEADNNIYLKQKDSVVYDRTKKNTITVFDLKYTLDPLNDYGMITQLALEMDEWIDQFYAPCLNELYGTQKADEGFSWFMAYPWYTHDTCSKLSCITNGMQWNRELGGCIASIVSLKYKAPTNFPTVEEPVTQDTGFLATDMKDGTKCKKDTKATATKATDCNTSLVNYNRYAQSIKECWEDKTKMTGMATGGLAIDYMVNNFCLPVMTTKKTTRTIPAEADLHGSAGKCKLKTSRRRLTQRKKLSDLVQNTIDEEEKEEEDE